MSAIRYELIGSENSGMSGALAIDAKYLDGENLREGPSFDYNLVEGMADATVRFFKIRRVYTFDNQE